MTDVKKNPRRYVLLKEMRRERKREDEAEKEKKGREEEKRRVERGEKAVRFSFPRFTGRWLCSPFSISRTICIPFSHAHLLKPRVEQPPPLRSQIDPRRNVAARVSRDFTLPKIH